MVRTSVKCTLQLCRLARRRIDASPEPFSWPVGKVGCDDRQRRRGWHEEGLDLRLEFLVERTSVGSSGGDAEREIAAG